MAMDLKEVWQAQKELASKPDWKPLAKGAEFVQLSCPIEYDAVTVQGLLFRATAHIYSADKAVTFQIEHHPQDNKGGAFARFEWRPRKGHGNKGIGPPEFRFKVITGCHFHPFDLNWDHSKALVQKGLLKIAVPVLPSPATYQEALAFVEKEFRIKGVVAMPTPPWTDKML
ncbi:MAG: hypothetical protein INF48_11865 [Rhodobacter sp.]|nr:hypothetical protein [Rhodobacter sp.]